MATTVDIMCPSHAEPNKIAPSHQHPSETQLSAADQGENTVALLESQHYSKLSGTTLAW